MANKTPDVYVGERKKNTDTLRQALELRKGTSPDGNLYLVRDIEGLLGNYNEVISRVDRRIEATEGDIKGLVKGSKNRQKYENDLTLLKEEKDKLESKRGRLQKRKWTEPIRYEDEVENQGV